MSEYNCPCCDGTLVRHCFTCNHQEPVLDLKGLPRCPSCLNYTLEIHKIVHPNKVMDVILICKCGYNIDKMNEMLSPKSPSPVDSKEPQPVFHFGVETLEHFRWRVKTCEHVNINQIPEHPHDVYCEDCGKSWDCHEFNVMKEQETVMNDVIQETSRHGLIAAIKGRKDADKILEELSKEEEGKE